MLQSSRNVGVSPLYWLIIPRAAACGTGIVKVIGLWNFLRRGSTVTMGETATRLPSSFTTSSGWIGWAYCRNFRVPRTKTKCYTKPALLHSLIFDGGQIIPIFPIYLNVFGNFSRSVRKTCRVGKRREWGNENEAISSSEALKTLFCLSLDIPTCAVVKRRCGNPYYWRK